jgi:hypothetical protein
MNTKVSILLWASLLVVPCACSKNDGPLRPTRNEYIKVYETSENKIVDDIQVALDGAQEGKIHILSNVSGLKWKYMVSQSAASTDWFQIISVEEVEPGHTVVTYNAASILDLNSMEQRSGNLSFYAPASAIGKYMTVRQGYQRRFIETFSAEPGENICLTGKEVFTTREYPELTTDYFDYIAFNAWAVTDNEYLTKNITLDVTVSGGKFYETNLTTYRINVPIGTAADKTNFKYLLLVGNGERMSNKTKFTFSVANDDKVYVYIDNFSAYRVTEADMNYLYDEDDFNWDDDDEGGDWI